VKISLDKEANALYVRFSESEISETAEVRPGVIIDYDAKGRIVGIEILNASEALAAPELKGLAVEVA
jgi:uncharacterized protein YuzE